MAEKGTARRASELAALRARLDQTKVLGRAITWYVTGWRSGLIWLAVAIVIPQLTADQSLLSILVDMGVYVMLALGLNIVVGYAGLLDLGYVAFYVLGAYTMAAGTSGFLSDAQGKAHDTATIPWGWLFILGALVAALFGVLLGAPTLRLRGDYLAIVTLGFGEIIPIIFNNIPFFFGSKGLSGQKPPPLVLLGNTFDLSSYTDYSAVYYLMLGIIALLVLFVASLRDSSIGRAWIAIREDETAASASGVNLVRAKLLAFAMGAAIGGVGGALSAILTTHVEPGSFTFNISITVLVMIVLGGIGSIAGVIIGAGLLDFFDKYVLTRFNEAIHASSLVADTTGPLHFLANVDFNQSRFLLYGLILLTMILLRPQGIIPDIRRSRELKGIGIAGEELSVVGVLEAEISGGSARLSDVRESFDIPGEKE